MAILFRPFDLLAPKFFLNYLALSYLVKVILETSRTHSDSRAYGSYQNFLDRGLILTRKLLNTGFQLVKLKSSLRKFNGRHHDLVDRYGISV